MPTSGEFDFSPTIAEIIDDAFERCGVDPASLTARHLRSAQRSVNFILSSWPNGRLKQWPIDLQEHTTTQGENEFTAPAGTVDVISMTLKRDDTETEMYRISREDWLAVVDKSIEGLPNQFFVDRSENPVVIRYWPAGQNGTDTIRYYRMRQYHTTGDEPSQNADIPPLGLEAFTAGVAYHLSKKYAQRSAKFLWQDYQNSLKDFDNEFRDRASLKISVRR